MNRLQAIWCYLFHRPQWTLYGGTQAPFTHCNWCCRIWGSRRTWLETHGEPWDVVSPARQDASVLSFDWREEQ